MRHVGRLLLALALLPATLSAQGGWLFTVGGGPRAAELMGRFVELAGGPDS